MGTLILQARDSVIEDNELSIGARLLFVRILDLSVRQASNVRPGVVTISQMKLAEKFGVAVRTIYNWKRELVRRRIVWMTEQPIPNAWPIDTYHVSAIHAPHNTGDKTTVEGAWGNGTRRRRPENLGFLAARNPVPQESSFHRQPVAGEKSLILPDSAGGSGSDLPASPENSFRSQQQNFSGGSGNGVPLPAENSFRSQRQPVAGGSGTKLPVGAATSCRHKKAKEQGSSHFEGGKAVPPPPISQEEAAFKRWELRLDDMRNSDLRKAEDIAKREFQDAKGDKSRELAKRKLVAIRLRLRGPAVAEDVPQVKPAKTATATRTLTDADLVEGVRKLIALGKPDLISEAGMAAILKNPAGLSPAEWTAVKAAQSKRAVPA